MKKLSLVCGIFFAAIAISSSVNALPVSNSDLWQNATITNKSSQHYAGPMSGMFDGNEADYGYENGNAIFADYGTPEGFIHWVEWTTNDTITLSSINLIAYHDFDDRDIRQRGFSEFSLYYRDGGSWSQIFNWQYENVNGDFHYGGGASYDFNPDLHDMNRSYLELTANLPSSITAQFFRAEFTQYGDMGGPRIVELDGYRNMQPVPEPATLLLLASGLIGIAGYNKKRKKSRAGFFA